MRKVTVILLLFLWILPATAQRPNIVLIVADDLGYGDLSVYGAEDLHSPVLDSLAATGIQFTQFYANSPVCSPTRASLLSYPSEQPPYKLSGGIRWYGGFVPS